MFIEIDKKYISEIIIRKKLVRLSKDYFMFLSMFGIDTIYMDNDKMFIGPPHPKEIKHPERANRLKKLHTYSIRFSKKTNMEKFLCVKHKMNI